MADPLENLPFDELDPCCQKEVLLRRRAVEIGKKLRSVDSSQRRIDLKDNLLYCFESSTALSQRCGCADSRVDYPSLSIVRASEARNANQCDVDNFDNSSTLKSNFGEDGEEDDEDYDFLMESIPITQNEKDRLTAVNAKLKERNLALSYGFGVHIEEFTNHIPSIFASTDIFPLVLHIYSDSLECARVDFALESLAEQFLGTRFRRSALTPSLANVLEKQCKVNSHEIIKGRILCFSSRNLHISIPIRDLGGEIQIDVYNAVLRSLDAAGILRSEFMNSNLISAHIPISNNLAEDDDDENDVLKPYCEQPNCTKVYPHEHIGQGNKPTFVNTQKKGLEALKDNIFFSL